MGSPIAELWHGFKEIFALISKTKKELYQKWKEGEVSS